jgi:RNA polymerase sigma factor (sigma-70 family)
MQPRLLKHPARLAGASLLRLQDDNRLVALAREGHDPAFAAIVDRYGPQLERYCARLLGPGRAEDAVQQAFVNAHAAMKTSDQELALKPWLYRIAHNASLNILRAAKGDGEALDQDRAGATQTADVVELRERLRETLAAIQALPAPQRDALLLRELEGRSHEEIALALGVTAGGARQHLHRARVSLRAAASAITPYPVLSRILTAAAADGRGADLVSGAGMGVSAGAVKAAAGVLAAGAIAGGAMSVQDHTRSRDNSAVAQHAAAQDPSPTAAAVASPVALTTSGHSPATAAAPRSGTQGTAGRHGHNGRHGAPSHRSGHDDGAEHEVEHHGSSGSSGSGSGTPTRPTSGDHSGPGGGTDDVVTTTTTPVDNSGPGSTSSGSGSDDGLSSGSSGPDGGTTTMPTTDDRSGSGSSGSGSGTSDHTTTTDD